VCISWENKKFDNIKLQGATVKINEKELFHKNLASYILQLFKAEFLKRPGWGPPSLLLQRYRLILLNG
jgi:hypothetical protein